MTAPSKPPTSGAAVDAFIQSEADNKEWHRRQRIAWGIDPTPPATVPAVENRSHK